MTTTRIRRLLVAGALGATALTLGTAGPAAAHKPCNSCIGDEPGEPGYNEEMMWLLEYEEELETTYGQSDDDPYPTSDQEVVAGPDGQGDHRRGPFPFPL